MSCPETTSLWSSHPTFSKLRLTPGRCSYNSWYGSRWESSDPDTLSNSTVSGAGYRVSVEDGTGTEVRDGLFWRGVRDGLFWRGGRTKRDKLKRILFFLFYCGQREITLSTEGPFEKLQRLCRFHSSRSSVPRKPNRNKMNDNKTESQNVFFNKCVCQRENMFEWGKMTSTLLVRSIFKPRMSFSSWVLKSLHWSYKCSRHTWNSFRVVSSLRTPSSTFLQLFVSVSYFPCGFKKVSVIGRTLQWLERVNT